jgi:hypothetical protein
MSVIKMRTVPKTSLSQRRPHSTAHVPEPTATYKYLTLSPQCNNNLSPFFPGVARILDKVGSSKRSPMYEPEAH